MAFDQIHYDNLQKEARARNAITGKAEPDSNEAKLAGRLANEFSGEELVLEIYKGLGGAWSTIAEHRAKEVKRRGRRKNEED